MSVAQPDLADWLQLSELQLLRTTWNVWGAMLNMTSTARDRFTLA